MEMRHPDWRRFSGGGKALSRGFNPIQPDATDRLLHTSLQRLIRIDDSLGMGDRLEPRSHLKIQSGSHDSPRDARPPPHRPQACGGQFPPSRRTPECATAAAENRRRSRHCRSDSAARTGAHREKSIRFGIPRQQILRSLQHQLQAEVVLPRRVFDLLGPKEGVPDFVLAQARALPCTPPVPAPACSCRCREARPSKRS